MKQLVLSFSLLTEEVGKKKKKNCFRKQEKRRKLHEFFKQIPQTKSFLYLHFPSIWWRVGGRGFVCFYFIFPKPI